MYDNIVSKTDSLSFAPVLIHRWIKDPRQGLEANAAVKAMLGMKNKCCVNVKVYFEIVCVHVCLFHFCLFHLSQLL